MTATAALPAPPPPRPPRAPAGFVTAVFARRLEDEWAPAMPAALRRGRFLALLYAAAAHADAYGVLSGPDAARALARSACLPAEDADRYLSALVAARLLRHAAPDRYVLASPTPPDWTAALAVLTDAPTEATP